MKEAQNSEIAISNEDPSSKDSAREELLAKIQLENLIYLNSKWDKSRFLT